MESFFEVLREPIVPFAVLLVVILTVPIICDRLRLPGIVGLLAAGVILGPNGLRLLNHKADTIKLLSDIGLLYLMFVAGLEIDIRQFHQTKNRSIGFGSLTFIVPLIFGTTVGRIFNFGWNASILMGSLFASHTLLAYPIVSRLGVVGNEAVTVTIGATIFTDIGALLVLAVCIGIQAGEFTIIKIITLIGSLIIYSTVVLFGLDWAGKEFFRRSGEEEGNQFLFILIAVFLSALGAQIIGVEKIVGAFLAGLAVNDAVREGRVKEKVIFVGSVLFIPIFFVDMGLLIDVHAFIKSLRFPWLTIAIVGGLITSKFLAALLAKLIYRYNWQEMLTMWSLSLPQVAATLAATLVGYRAGLLTEGVLNSIIVLMLVTSTLGPLITARVAVGLRIPENKIKTRGSSFDEETGTKAHRFTVVVPVYNPQTEQYLIEMAALLARHEGGRIVALAIAIAHTYMDSPEMETTLQQTQALLERARLLSLDLGVEVEPLLRIDDVIANGITRASREQNANLIVMGWAKQTGLQARLFGNIIDDVLSSSHCPVAVTRFLQSPLKIKRILVPVESPNYQAARALRLAQILAEENQAEVMVLNVCERLTSDSQIDWIESQLSQMFLKPAVEIQIQVVRHADIVKAILNASQSVDLVILRAWRRRTSAGLVVSDLMTELIEQLTCSLIMLGEPFYSHSDVFSSPSS